MAAILSGFALLLLIDLAPVIRRRDWRGAIAFLCFFVPGLVLAVLRHNMIDLPSALLLLGDLLKAWGISY